MDFYYLNLEDREALLDINLGIKPPAVSPNIKRAFARRYCKVYASL